MMHYNAATAVLIARVFLGLLFTLQGFDKIFKVGMRNVAETFRFEIHLPWLPVGAYKLIAVITSYIEFIAGVLLIIGYVKYIALALLGLDLVIVALGMSLMKPVWNLDVVFPRLLLILFLLVTPPTWDLFSMDYLLLTK